MRCGERGMASQRQSLRPVGPVARLGSLGKWLFMAMLIVIPLLALGSWGVLGTFRRLRRSHASRAWWFAFVWLSVVGLAAGGWLSFSFEYQVSPEIRYFSFPMPVAFFHLEDGQWVDYITPPYVMFPGLVANVVAIVAVALLPLLLASLALGRRRRAHEIPTI